VTSGGTPLVIAHRGSSATWPEHTLDAYRQAIDEGADGLECDVRLTRDGHLVCIHDGRLDRTSDGRGRVSAATLGDLERLNFGHSRSGRVTTARILTLDRLIETALEAGRPLRLLIETKHPSRYGSAVERKVIEMLDRYGLAKGDASTPLQVSVMSFSPLAVRTVRALAPGLPTVFLYEFAPPRVRDGRTPFGAQIVGPGLGVVRARPDVVERAHDRGLQVYVWTVNQPADVDFVLGLGVEALISDRPAYVLERLRG
jgi:glycerophosphoryl diester phosphodiesterase